VAIAVSTLVLAMILLILERKIETGRRTDLQRIQADMNDIELIDEHPRSQQ